MQQPSLRGNLRSGIGVTFEEQSECSALHLQAAPCVHDLRPRLRLADVGLASLSAVLLILSFPKFDLGVLGWVSLVPLLVALEEKSPKQAFVLSYVTGLIFFVCLFYWIWFVPGWNFIDGLLTQAVYLPQYVSLWGLGLNWLRKDILNG